jgi:hypothetical protein
MPSPRTNTKGASSNAFFGLDVFVSPKSEKIRASFSVLECQRRATKKDTPQTDAGIFFRHPRHYPQKCSRQGKSNTYWKETLNVRNSIKASFFGDAGGVTERRWTFEISNKNVEVVQKFKISITLTVGTLSSLVTTMGDSIPHSSFIVISLLSAFARWQQASKIVPILVTPLSSLLPKKTRGATFLRQVDCLDTKYETAAVEDA